MTFIPVRYRASMNDLTQMANRTVFKNLATPPKPLELKALLSSDLELRTALWLTRFDLDASDDGLRATFLAPCEHRLHGVGGPFEVCLDAPIGAIPHPTSNAVLGRLFGGGCSEKDALNPTSDDDTNAE